LASVIDEAKAKQNAMPANNVKALLIDLEFLATMLSA